ncbi:MAG: hypothetical protein B6I20_08515 [Bacteroidetes bacterium 4572_117]|nr:MAG: hypothetical protein B6I20_08515 [Bacteroidetes bacterium 4572_117]
MLEDQDKIDDLFNDFLRDYEEDVPHFVWNNLKTDLKAEKRFRILYYLKAVAASVALLVTFGLGYFVSDLSINKNTKGKALLQDKNKLYFTEKPKTSGDSLGLDVTETEENTDEPETIKYRAKTNKYRDGLKKSDLMLQIANYESIGIYDTNQLYRKYKFIDKIFASNKGNEKTSNLALNDLSEKKSNQLLTDTLLLEKENLLNGGFLLIAEKKKVSGWSFGTKFSPVFALGDISTGGAQSNNSGVISGIKSDIPNLEAEEKAHTTYTGGLNVNYNISRRFSIESGIFYSQKKQGADNLVGSRNTEFGGNETTIYTPSGNRAVDQVDVGSVLRSSFSTTYYTLNADFILNADYIELPLIIRYKLIDQKVSLDVMSGFSTNFLVNNNSLIVSGNEELWSGKTNNISSVLYGATFGLGVNYNFYQNFTFNVEPTLKYSILPENSVFKKYPYSFAVFAGFSYRFKH